MSDATTAAPSSSPTGERPSSPGGLHASRALRRSLFASGVALLALALYLVVSSPPGAGVPWLLLGVAITVVVVAERTRTADGIGCAFCGAARDRVRFLVSGGPSAICPECAAAVAARTAEEHDHRGRTLEWLHLFLAGLPEHAPLAVSRPYIELVAESDRSPAAVRRALATAFRFGHHRLAREWLETIPDADRTAIDWLNIGYSLGEEGRLSEALAATETAGRLDTGPERPWCLNNAAWFRSQVRSKASEADRMEWLAQVREAQRLLSERMPARWKNSLAYFFGTEAELLRQVGDLEGALRALDEADRHDEASSGRCLVRARVLAASRRLGEAREAAGRALQLARPESHDAAEARSMLEQFGERTSEGPT